jgi:hypothetical protein
MFARLLCVSLADSRKFGWRYEVAVLHRSAALGLALDAATRAYAELLSALALLARARQRAAEGASAEATAPVLYADLALAEAAEAALDARRAVAELLAAAAALQGDVAVVAQDCSRFAGVLDTRPGSESEAAQGRRKASFMRELERRLGVVAGGEVGDLADLGVMS